MNIKLLLRTTIIFCTILLNTVLRCSARNVEDFEERYKSEDVLILNERTAYTLIGVKLDFLNLVIEKNLEYKILTRTGAEKLQQIVLPEPIDETYFVHAPAIRNKGSLLDNSIILAFSCSITKPDGTSSEIGNTIQKRFERTINESGFFGEVPSYWIDIKGLAPGDILKVHYRIKIPYRNNIYQLMSCRLFFHREYPVKSQIVSFEHDKTLVVDTSSNKLIRPVVTDKGNSYSMEWHHDNLPGSLAEKGSHPYKDLPWFIFSPRVYESLHMDFDSFKEDFIKPWYLMTFNKEAGFESCLRDFRQGINNENNYGYNKTALRFNNSGDTSGAGKLWHFQKWMADTVHYDPDTLFYSKLETYLKDKPGADLYGGKVRDHCKDLVYASMLPRLGYYFLNAIVMDKRVGEPTLHYYAPMHDNDLLFAVTLNNALSYLVPKSDVCSYYFEELPFYYENVTAFLLHPSDLPGYKRNYFDSVRVVKTPGSIFTDNLRNTTGSLSVHQQESSVEFQVKITLSGQYSTLTRGVYLEKPADRTINPLYFSRVWDIHGGSKPVSVSVLQNDYAFPYKTSISVSFKADSVIKTSNAISEIDLTGWLKHIIYPGFTASGRVTDYYADFTGSDKYFFMLTFDTDIELMDTPEHMTIDNAFGSYNFSVRQTDKNKVLLTSFFTIKSDRVPAERTIDVEQIYAMIGLADKQKIRYKTIEGNTLRDK